LAGILRPGNPGANTAADHIAVLEQALRQLPEPAWGMEILVRTDSGGVSHDFVNALRGLETCFSISFDLTEPVREAILATPESAWVPAGDVDARPAVQLDQDVVDVHLHGSGAEAQVAGDLAARLAGGDEAGDLQLAPREPRVLGPRRADAAQPPAPSPSRPRLRAPPHRAAPRPHLLASELTSVAGEPSCAGA